MRVSLLVVSSALLMIHPAAAQSGRFGTRDVLAPLPADSHAAPIGSDAGLAHLERSALAGDRRASALLALLLQERPDMAGSLVRSALHLQVAIAAGCSDLDAIADDVVARLSPVDRAAYDQALPHWVGVDGAPVALAAKGRCLAAPSP